MADIIQQRRDTAARWKQYNPILLEGEVGYVTDNPNQYKIGDGKTPWNSLPLRGYTGTITQDTGSDENAVMSQKVVTEKLSELGSEVRMSMFDNSNIIEKICNNESDYWGEYSDAGKLKKGDVVYFYAEIIGDYGATDPVYAELRNSESNTQLVTVKLSSDTKKKGLCFISSEDVGNARFRVGSNQKISCKIKSVKLNELGRDGFVIQDLYQNGYWSGKNGTNDIYYTENDLANPTYISVLPSTTYKIIGNNDSYNVGIWYYDNSYTYINRLWFNNIEEFTTPENCRFVNIGLRKTDITQGLEIPKIQIIEDVVQFKNITTSPYIIESIPNAYVKTEDGSVASASYVWSTLKFSVKGISKVNVTGMWYDNSTAAIAFFSDEGIYLSESTVEGINATVATTLKAVVPTQASYALACSTRNFAPIVEVVEIGAVLKDFTKDYYETKEQVGTNIKKTTTATISSIVYPTTPCMDYHHLFIDKIYTNSVVTIPSQSVFDVCVAAKLGFKMIEANVNLTSDGIPVTGHQAKSGGYLQTLTDLDGNPTEVKVTDITFEDLRANYRYKSIFPQYRTPITSLEEFLHECKKYDLTPLVQCASESVIKLTESIMGKRYVAYNATRKQTDATITEYRGGTIDELVDRCKSIGQPYMLSISANTINGFSDDEIKELASRVHAEGCWLGWAGCYHSVEESLRYKGLGLDFNASGWEIPDFNHGNEVFIYGNSINEFKDFGSSLEIDNGILKMKPGQSLSKWFEQKSILSKGSLHIHYKGVLGVTFGKLDDKITSEGEKEMVITSIIENTEPRIYLYAYTDVEVYSISYKVSSVI